MDELPVIRDCRPEDASALAPLLVQLGYPATPEEFMPRIEASTANGAGRVIVAELGGVVRGVITIFHIRTIHRPGDICRITALVVDDGARGSGIGRRLVEEVERHARATGCVRVEVTSAAQRHDAHAFYWRLGYQEYPKRFIRDL